MIKTKSQTKDGLLLVQQLQEGERIRVALHGELDMANAITAELALNEALASSREVVVDLGKLEFLDSTGVAMLVMAMRDPSGERLSFLPSEHPGVTRLLSLTGLDQRMGLASRSSRSEWAATGITESP